MHDAAYSGNVALIEQMLRDGADVNETDKKGCTALHFAVIESQDGAILALLDAKADVHMQDKQDRTAMHLACDNGNETAVKQIIEHSTCRDTVLNGKGEFLQTPLHYAAYAGHGGVVQVLVDAKSDLHNKDILKRTPLQGSRALKQDEVILILKGAEPSGCVCTVA